MEYFESHKNLVYDNITEHEFYSILSQCGLKAIEALRCLISFECHTDIYGDPYWDITERGICFRIIPHLDKKLLRKLVERGKMDYQDIVEAMRSIQPDYYPDFRYSSPYRDMEGKIFQSPFYGIVAMNFEKTNEVHWAALGMGAVYPLFNGRSYTTIEKLREDVPGFDGLGHTIIYRQEKEMNFLKQHRNCAKQYCSICNREKWCSEKL